MPRTKGGFKTRARRKKVLKLASGFWGARRKLYRSAKPTVDRALAFAYVGRKLKKRNFSSLWIQRINAATRMHDMSYSKFIHGLELADVNVDRKVLADLAVHEPNAFTKLIEVAKSKL